MNYKDLESKDLIAPYSAPKEQIGKEMRLAERDIKVAKKNLEEDYDWALAIAYNAVLQIGRALMLSKGYRPRGQEQHKTVLKFMEISLGKSFEEKFRTLDSIRVKRHRVIYDEPELISESEANLAVEIASEFVDLIKDRLTK